MTTVPRLPSGLGDLHTSAGDTEVEAAVAQIGKKDADALEVLCLIVDAGDEGLTPYELKRDWKIPFINTPAARATNLKDMDPPLVRDSGRRRPTNTGKSAMVLVSTRIGRLVARRMR